MVNISDTKNYLAVLHRLGSIIGRVKSMLPANLVLIE